MWRWWNYFASHNHFTFLRVFRTVELGFDAHDLNWLVSRLLNAHDLWIKIISVYLIFTGGLLVLWASYLSMVLKCLQETCKILDFSFELTENIYCKQKIFLQTYLRHLSRLVVAGEPRQALVQAVPRGGAGRLDVPVSVPQSGEPKLLLYLVRLHGWKVRSVALHCKTVQMRQDS